MGSRYNTNLHGLETVQVGWHSAGTIDATAGAADGALGVAERDYDTAVALDNAVAYSIPPEINLLQVRVAMTTNDADVVMDVYARKNGDDELKRVCRLTCKCGTQDCGASNHFCDTQTVSETGGWFSAPTTKGTTANEIAETYIYTMGYSDFVFHGHTTVDEDAIIYVSGLSCEMT